MKTGVANNTRSTIRNNEYATGVLHYYRYYQMAANITKDKRYCVSRINIQAVDTKRVKHNSVVVYCIYKKIIGWKEKNEFNTLYI